jgi:hypothetical protein
MTMKLIQTQTLASAAASVDFTSIPQDGTDLLLLVSGRGTDAVVSNLTILRINGDALNNSFRRLQGSGTAVTSTTGTSSTSGMLPAATSTANTFGNQSFYIPNYTGTANKTISIDAVSENNATEAYQTLQGSVKVTGAINEISMSIGVGSYVAGTTMSLYKITKGSDGIVIV